MRNVLAGQFVAGWVPHESVFPNGAVPRGHPLSSKDGKTNTTGTGPVQSIYLYPAAPQGIRVVCAWALTTDVIERSAATDMDRAIMGDLPLPDGSRVAIRDPISGNGPAARRL